MSLTLVTGATGFLGSRIVRCLLDDKVPVRATSRAASPQFALPDYRSADLLSAEKCSSLMPNVRCVIHSAGLAHRFKRDPGDKDNFEAINAIAAEQLARAAAAAGVERFVFVSSISVYGPGETSLRDESAPCHPHGPYAESKLSGELRVLRVSRETGLPVTVLRLATLYGEGDRGNVSRLMRAIDRRRFFWVGDGNNLKTLLHVDDAAWACTRAAQSPRGSNGKEVFNVCGAPCTMRQVVEGLAQGLGRRSPRLQVPSGMIKLALSTAAVFGPWRERASTWRGTLDKWLADDSYCGEQFQREFGFQPQVELLDGLNRQVTAYRSDCSTRASEK